MSKILKTETEYRKRSVQLIKKAMKELGIKKEEDLDMRQFVVWLANKRPTISRPTWRQYKSSVIYFLEQLDSEDALYALEYIREKDSSGCILKSDKTSSRKLKKISLKEWEKIENHLKTNSGKWFANLHDWLKSGLLTGLRPIEWKNTKFFLYQDKIPALLVENAKHTNGRSNGAVRTLLLEDLSIQELKTIKDHLSNVRTFTSIGEDGYDFFYSGCSFTLNKICRKIWPRRLKHITLYSTRHQFSANAKSSGFSKAEVAAMMGHAVDITATIHYGKKISGNDSILIKPVKEEVDTVRVIPTTDFKDLIRQKRDNLL